MQEIHIPRYDESRISEKEVKERAGYMFEYIADNKYILDDLSRDAAEKAVGSIENELATRHLYVPGLRDYCSKDGKEYYEELQRDNFDAFVPFVQSCAFLASRQYTDTIGFFENLVAKLKQVNNDEFTEVHNKIYGGLDKENIGHVSMYMQLRFEETYGNYEYGSVREVIREYISEALSWDNILKIIRRNPNYAEDFAANTL